MMTTVDWTEMEKTIRKCPENTRYRLQPKLAELIRAMRARGEPVPPEARQLNTELRAEAIEAQFDNLPV